MVVEIWQREYIKVLKEINQDFIVIGRGHQNCQSIKDEFNCDVVPNGLIEYLNTKPSLPACVIVCVSIEELSKTSLSLINYGVKKILLEKPGVAFPYEINEVTETALRNNAKVFLGYNRRFYASVLKANEMIKEDGGVHSFSFEFTEWAHVIKNFKFSDTILHNWFLGNSTHVIDTAFFLGGKPQKIAAFYKGYLNWHPTSSCFCGAGISETGALFSYLADWEAPGRWGIDIMTIKRRFIFKPMESLQVQILGSVEVNVVEIDATLDINFKPGIYLQTKAFLEGNYERFCTIEEQRFMINNIYAKMSGY